MFNEYANFVDKLFKHNGNFQQELVHAAMGISGEAGELIDQVKKHWVYNKPLDRNNMLEEMGDLLFYFMAMQSLMGFNLKQIIDFNMAKLNKRYPQGYTDKAAQDRADKKLDVNEIAQTGKPVPVTPDLPVSPYAKMVAAVAQVDNGGLISMKECIEIMRDFIIVFDSAKHAST